ncbi:hypothetical protein Hanom_Chr16g01518321 [Helianthus anomalus]
MILFIEIYTCCMDYFAKNEIPSTSNSTIIPYSHDENVDLASIAVLKADVGPK